MESVSLCNVLHGTSFFKLRENPWKRIDQMQKYSTSKFCVVSMFIIFADWSLPYLMHCMTLMDQHWIKVKSSFSSIVFFNYLASTLTCNWWMHHISSPVASLGHHHWSTHWTSCTFCIWSFLETSCLAEEQEIQQLQIRLLWWYFPTKENNIQEKFYPIFVLKYLKNGKFKI